MQLGAVRGNEGQLGQLGAVYGLRLLLGAWALSLHAHRWLEAVAWL